MRQNPHFQKVASRYLFQEIAQRVKAFKSEHPEARVLSLGIGDTTEPVGPFITNALKQAAEQQGARETYAGYGPEQGISELRSAISQTVYQGRIAPDDIFVSDGAKCDLGRLQVLFGPDATIALQDPTYPVYLDTALMFRGSGVKTLACTPLNNFLPDIEQAKECDILFLCLPNNPTGTMCTFDELRKIVLFAKDNGITIVYDAAYSFYVKNGPKSIYDIPEAKEVAIELGSFSKIAGFSGIRLGWTVIPDELCYTNGKKVKPDWSRIATTFFNGASILSQRGGIAALSSEGLVEVHSQVQFYRENIGIVKQTLEALGIEVYGGVESPYAWARIPGYSSWQLFDELLHKAHIVTTPGSGFGPSGEGFVRISGFASREVILEAAKRIKELLQGALTCRMDLL